jgi:hypothetical protein
VAGWLELSLVCNPGTKKQRDSIVRVEGEFICKTLGKETQFKILFRSEMACKRRILVWRFRLRSIIALGGSSIRCLSLCFYPFRYWIECLRSRCRSRLSRPAVRGCCCFLRS